MKKPLLLGIIFTACIVIVTFVFAQFYPEGMISYWKFEDGSGTTASDSFDTNDGTIYGTQWTSGMVNGALRFDGFADYVKVDDDDSLSTAAGLTVEAWIKADSFGNIDMVVGKWNGGIREYEIQLRNGKVWFFAFPNDGTPYKWAISLTTLNQNTWYHVAGVFDDNAKELRVYIDGLPDGDAVSFLSSIPNTDAFLSIGGQFWPAIGAWKNFFVGVIDEVAIYGRALTAEEIQQHYENGLNNFMGYEVECAPSGMVGWWPGDGNADNIKNGNHGTLQNGAMYAPGMVAQAFGFDGLDDYVSIPHSPSLNPTNAITLDAWIFIENYTFYPAVVNKGNVGYQYDESYALFIDPSGRLGFLLNRDGTASGRTIIFGPFIPLNSWTYVTGTYDGVTMRLYADEQMVGSASHSGGMWATPAYPVLIGKSERQDDPNGLESSFFDGLIDEVEIFNRALSQSEIQAIYNAGSAGKCKVEPNQPPVAVCKDTEIHVDGNCQAFITAADVDGGSNDPDGEDDIAEIWVDNLGPFSVGTYTVNLSIKDKSGEIDTCQATVIVKDTTPPEISVTVSPDTLRPPNHKMVLIEPQITFSDNCTPNSEIELVLTSITMNENDETNTFNPILDETLGDGHTIDDIQVEENGDIYLRAERSGKGDGRTYTITYTATDASGNSATATATVTVPHDRK